MFILQEGVNKFDFPERTFLTRFVSCLNVLYGTLTQCLLPKCTIWYTDTAWNMIFINKPLLLFDHYIACTHKRQKDETWINPRTWWVTKVCMCVCVCLSVCMCVVVVFFWGGSINAIQVVLFKNTPKQAKYFLPDIYSQICFDKRLTRR